MSAEDIFFQLYWFVFISALSEENGLIWGTCIKRLFWPPLEPKTENCFSPISSDWFISRITEV